jgi:tetratricopeptide (TPR) repeat protein
MRHWILFTAAFLAFGSSDLLRAQSNNPDLRYVKNADSLFAAGQYKEAVREYNRAPVTADVLRKIGACYIRLWDMPSAIRSLRRARLLAPQDSGIEAALADALSWDKEFEEAISVYRDAVAKGNRKTDVLLGYARTLAWGQKYDEAERQYSQILTGDSANFAARMGLAQTLSWAKDFDASVREYTRAAALTPDANEKSQALAGVGRVLSWSGKFDEAIARYNAALEASSKNTDALFGLGEIHEWLGRYQKAKWYYEQILQIQPQHKAAKAKLLQLMWVK